MTLSKYRIFQRNILDLMTIGGVQGDGQGVDGPRFFITCIPIEFNEIALRHGCKVVLSPTRLMDAQRTWVYELGRQEIEDGNSRPDHFKHAGLLAYWLRRHKVVDDTETLVAYDTDAGKALQDRFLRAPAEVGAFILGHKIAGYHEYFIQQKHRTQEISLERFLADSMPTEHFMDDLSVYMKNKHVSPHSMYLIFRSIFERSRS